MILGSHDTMTYLKPASWWMYLGRFAYLCQNKTLEQQIEAGVRAIDLRVRFDKNGKLRFCHGLFSSKLNMSVDEAAEYIIETIKQRKGEDYFYIRIVLETYIENSFQENHFREFAASLNEHATETIVVFGGYRRFDWKRLVGNVPSLIVNEPISSVADDARWYERVCPYLYAKRNNSRNMQELSEQDVAKGRNYIAIFDFI